MRAVCSEGPATLILSSCSHFVCSHFCVLSCALEASLEPVEAAETAKAAKIRRLKMRLKRPAAYILIMLNGEPRLESLVLESLVRS